MAAGSAVSFCVDVTSFDIQVTGRHRTPFQNIKAIKLNSIETI